MHKATDLQVLMIAAVRADERVGRESGSHLSSLSDERLLELLVEHGAEGPAEAVKVARVAQQRHECSEKHWED